MTESKKENLMKNYKPTDPEMIQAQKDLAKMSNLSDRVITNDDDLFQELSTIQRKLCEISELKLISYKDMRTYLMNSITWRLNYASFNMRCFIASS